MMPLYKVPTWKIGRDVVLLHSKSITNFLKKPILELSTIVRN